MCAFPSHPRNTMLVKAPIGKRGMEKVLFLPACIDHRAQPRALGPGDPEFQGIPDCTGWVSDRRPHALRAGEDEIVVDNSR
jgi:hypothetical protein